MSFMIMCVEGIEFFHLDRNVVWYECASGISTGNSDKWGKILRDEEITMFRYVSEIIKIKDFDSFRLKLVVKYILRTRINFMKYIVFPELIKIKLYKNKIKAMTSLESGLSYISGL